MKPGDISGYIHEDARLSGTLSFEGIVRIDGKFTGDIDAKGMLIIGENGLVESTIKVDIAVISGLVRGMIEASTKVELIGAGKVYGDIKTKDLLIGEGTVFEGKCEMSESNNDK